MTEIHALTRSEVKEHTFTLIYGVGSANCCQVALLFSLILFLLSKVPLHHPYSLSASRLITSTNHIDSYLSVPCWIKGISCTSRKSSCVPRFSFAYLLRLPDPPSTLKRMSVFRTAKASDGSPVINDRSYPEVTQGDQYPEVNTEHEDLEIARDYPQVNNNKYSPLREKESADRLGSKPDEYRICGLRPWVLIALVCVIAIAIAIGVGLAVGIPASKQNHENKYVIP